MALGLERQWLIIHGRRPAKDFAAPAGSAFGRLNAVQQPHPEGCAPNERRGSWRDRSWTAKPRRTEVSRASVEAILSLSPRTVDKHRELIFAKLGVENRTAAAALLLGPF